ncbi:MAG: DUF3305 domain-containing protein [Gammaproteobacteria bacterium]|jgi:hypothetical protein
MLGIESTPNEMPTELPVAVVLQREVAVSGRWRVPRWKLLDVVAGEGIAAGPGEAAERDVADRVVWGGLSLRLYRDSAESYWYNLVGNTPSLFVVLQTDDDDGLVPVAVTANYDEAGAHLEGDDTVLSVPMSASVYRWLEQYVRDNYRPQPRKARKRKPWIEEMDDDRGQR